MSQCKTQADCFRELARVIDMCEETAVPILMAMKNTNNGFVVRSLPNFDYPKQWRFAVAIVENKPVFIGDTLYTGNGMKFIIDSVRRTDSYTDHCTYLHGVDLGELCVQHGGLSWNPPKPKEPEIPEGYTRYDGGGCPVKEGTEVTILFASGDTCTTYTTSSWVRYDTDPDKIIAYKTIKPATVMIEVSVNDAEYLASVASERLAKTYAIDMVGIACCKALEKIKC